MKVELTLVPWGALTTSEAGRYWGTTWSLSTSLRFTLFGALKIRNAFSLGAKMVSLVPDFTAFLMAPTRSAQGQGQGEEKKEEKTAQVSTLHECLGGLSRVQGLPR